MAARGIETFEEAGQKFLADAKAFHANQSLSTGEDIEAYCQKRAALKAREYNTRMGGGDDET